VIDALHQIFLAFNNDYFARDRGSLDAANINKCEIGTAISLSHAYCYTIKVDALMCGLSSIYLDMHNKNPRYLVRIIGKESRLVHESSQMSTCRKNLYSYMIVLNGNLFSFKLIHITPKS